MNEITLAVDINGGDYNSNEIVKGALDSLKEKCEVPFSLILCGDQNSVKSFIEQSGNKQFLNSGKIKIEHSENYTINTFQAIFWKNHRNSSIIRSIELQKTGYADATISVGSTGVLLSASVFILGKEKNISRPALGAFLPTQKNKPLLLIDVGANISCKSKNYIDFTYLGLKHLNKMFSLNKEFRFAILNVGKEDYKGSKELKEANKILKDMYGDNYCGFCEGYDIFTGEYDMIVTDGHTGNVILKLSESIKSMIKFSKIENFFSMQNKLFILKSGNYGSVPILGINGNVFKAHGASDSDTFKKAIITAAKYTAGVGIKQ